MVDLLWGSQRVMPVFLPGPPASWKAFAGLRMVMARWFSIHNREVVMFIDKRYRDVRRFVEKEEGGIYKRIDENRELFELLCREHPEVFRKNPWASRWLSSQDRFLKGLAEITEQDERGHSVREVTWQGC